MGATRPAAPPGAGGVGGVARAAGRASVPLRGPFEKDSHSPCGPAGRVTPAAMLLVDSSDGWMEADPEPAPAARARREASRPAGAEPVRARRGPPGERGGGAGRARGVRERGPGETGGGGEHIPEGLGGGEKRLARALWKKSRAAVRGAADPTRTDADDWPETGRASRRTLPRREGDCNSPVTVCDLGDCVVLNRAIRVVKVGGSVRPRPCRTGSGPPMGSDPCSVPGAEHERTYGRPRRG